MRLAALAFTGLAALAGFATSAQAQQCGNLVQALKLEMADHGNFFTVPVTINGQPKQFLIDTGGTFTQVSRATAKAMGLQILPSPVRMYDMYGNQSADAVRVDIGFGGAVAKQHMSPVIGINNVDGIFAADFMQRWDVDLDFAGKTMSYFMPDHCEGRVVYWPHGVVATVPFRGWAANSDNKISLTVKLDGHEIPATLDTGASNSTLDASTAHQLFDIGPDSPGAVPMGNMTANGGKIFGWTFKTLEVGGITIDNPRLRVLPALMGKSGRDDIAADSHIQRITDGMQPTMLLGMDVLRRLHIYIAVKEKKLYVTAGSDQTTQRGAAAAPGTAAETPVAH